MFSRRTAWDRTENALARAVAARRAAGLPLIDLTQSNPTQCGFAYDTPTLLAPLANARALTYDPVPFGHAAARAAVCSYYRDHAASVEPRRVCLTTSTSEAYSFLFRLLCDPGDEVLIAQPSYPLFDFLADLDDVSLISYPLFYDHGWQTEPDALRERITPRTRAIAVVHPNNPTGHYLSFRDRVELDQLCAEHELALLVDEVFLDYPLTPNLHPVTFAGGPSSALTFILSGLSKVAALPQMKASWIVTAGPEPAVEEALARLELIADTFLSISAPIQHALPALLASRGAIQEQILARTRANLAALDTMLAEPPLASRLVSRLEVQAGWYAILRTPALGAKDSLVLELAERWGVLAHPGHFYGLKAEGRMVVSLLPPPSEFAAGMQSVLACCDARARDTAQTEKRS